MASPVFWMLVIYCQKPLTVFDKFILFDKFLFHPCRWMMFAPCLPLVGNELPLFVKPVGVFKCAVVELHRHSEARNR